MKSKRTIGGLIGPIILLLILVTVFFWYSSRDRSVSSTYSNSQFQEDIEEGMVSSVIITQNKAVPTGKIQVNLKDDTDSVRRILYVSDVNATQQVLTKNDIPYSITDVASDSFGSTFLYIGLGILFLVFMMMMISGRSGGNANMKAMNFGKNRARMVSKEENKIKFPDVAGLDEEKENVQEIVDFLKNPRKYTQLGARIPKGVLLVGPPGTGKTLLAKAIAGEAGVPFFTISGSDFVEMFVGVGASRVRELFADAKKNHPCIVFIDEIDAVARRRGTGMGGGHDEREQTLNQLLVEMDGFSVNEGIIVLAATNRVDILDPAILRPGRFDRKVGVGVPDVRGREAILKVHARKKPLAEDVDLKQIAQTTAGFAGADLENLLNEAAIYAARDNKSFIQQSDIKRAFIRIGLGEEKKSRIISDKEKRITAYHEAGHAILFHVLPDMGPVFQVSIIPTGMGAAGYTMPLPERDEIFNTKGKMIQSIIVGLGGRVAEELIFDDITTGASQDIKQVTQTARHMVTRYGMSDAVGLINYNDDSDEVVIGRDLAHARAYGETVATQIDSEVKRIIDECYEEARRILKENDHVLHSCASLLLDREKIGREEFEALFAIGEPMPIEGAEVVSEEALETSP